MDVDYTRIAATSWFKCTRGKELDNSGIMQKVGEGGGGGAGCKPTLGREWNGFWGASFNFSLSCVSK